MPFSDVPCRGVQSFPFRRAVVGVSSLGWAAAGVIMPRLRGGGGSDRHLLEAIGGRPLSATIGTKHSVSCQQRRLMIIFLRCIRKNKFIENDMTLKCIDYAFSDIV